MALLLAGCSTKDSPGLTGSSGGLPSGTSPTSGPSDVQLAYGISLRVPSTYTLAGTVEPNAATKASLDSRRKGGERVLMLETVGTPSSRGIDPMVALFLVNQEGTFMPREYAERIKPEELNAIGKEILAKEQAEAKKKKKPSGLLDLKINRESINGKIAIAQRMLVAGPDGNPARLIHWDIFLPDGAGIAVRAVYDQDVPGAEAEISTIVRSIRVQ